MYNRKSSFFKHIDFFILDLLCLLVSFLLAYLIRARSPNFHSNNLYINIILWMMVPNIIYYILFNPYTDVLRRDNIDEVKTAVTQTIINFLFTVAIMFVLRIGALYSRLILFYTDILYPILSTLVRIFWKRLIQKGVIRISDNNPIRMLLIAEKETVGQVIYNLNNSDYDKYSITGIYLVDDSDTLKIQDYPVISNASDIHDFVVSNNIVVAFISCDLGKREKRIIKKLIQEGIEIQLYIDSVFDVEAEDREIDSVGMYNTVRLNSFSFSTSQRFYFVIKRFLDIILSIIGIIMMIPVYLFIKISYLLSGDTYPIIYKHTRIGLDGKPFELYKFRSMVHNADEMLEEILKNKELKKEWQKNQKLENDPRITKVGRFIRKTSIDEMPQFINVLKGEMSVIGPRPLVENELISKNGIKLYERVKPGITGWWACNGRSNMSYEERLEHEYYYVRNCSLTLDALCVLRTIYVVIFEKGAK